MSLRLSTSHINHYCFPLTDESSWQSMAKNILNKRYSNKAKFGFKKIGVLWPRSKFVGCRSEAEGSNYPEMVRRIDDSYAPTPFNSYPGGAQYIQRYKIQGITKDANGDPLGYCIVQLIRVSTNELVDTFLSDSVGNYQVWTPYTDYHYCIAFKALAPDVAGITVKTLTGTIT